MLSLLSLLLCLNVFLLFVLIYYFRLEIKTNGFFKTYNNSQYLIINITLIILELMWLFAAVLVLWF